MFWNLMAKFFGGAGLVCLLIALVFGVSTQLFLSQASVADGTVIGPRNPESGRKYASTISFTTANGQAVQFTTSVSSSPPEFQLGQKVKIYYSPDNPEASARPDSFLSLWFLPGLFGLLALIFGGLGIGFYMVDFLNRRKIKWLQTNGQRVTAVVSEVRLNTSLKNRGKSPYVVTAQWRNPANSQLYSFKSNSLWVEPAPVAPGKEVSVLVDPKDFGRYHMEI